MSIYANEQESQPFGELMIESRPGTLIPRWETEEWSSLLAEKIVSLSHSIDDHEVMNVVDICCGTGCIALNIANLVKRRNLSITGIDISQKAVAVSRINKVRNTSFLPQQDNVSFLKMDLFSDAASQLIRKAVVITMNPPYVPLEEEQKISLSARRYEPRAALVPRIGTAYEHGEIFYARVIGVLTTSKAETRILAFEIGSQSQAERVSSLIENRLRWRSEIWNDSADRARCVFAYRPTR